MPRVAMDGSRTTATPPEPTREERFEELFAEYAGYVHATFQRLGVRRSEADDLTQELFITIYDALDTYDAARPVKPWLFAFCRNAAANHRRLARHRRLEAQNDDCHRSEEHDPEEAAMASEARSLLERAMDVLSDDHREVFVLHDIDGASGPEIAEALGIPLNTAYSRIRLARRGVEAALRDLTEGGDR
jgi:RNA polymerase sigma-70 factor, ECF subfamily